MRGREIRHSPRMAGQGCGDGSMSGLWEYPLGEMMLCKYYVCSSPCVIRTACKTRQQAELSLLQWLPAGAFTSFGFVSPWACPGHPGQGWAGTWARGWSPWLGRAVGSWRPSLLQCCWGRDRQPWWADTGSWAVGEPWGKAGHEQQLLQSGASHRVPAYQNSSELPVPERQHE